MHNNFSKLLGEKLIKISDVSKKTGISKTTLGNIYYQRADDFKYSTIKSICDFFNIGIDDFFKK